MKKQFLFLILLGLLCSVGSVWGEEYALLDHTNKKLTGNFICNPATPTNDARTIDGKTFACYVVTTGNLASWSAKAAESYTIDYDIKTTSTTFTIYVGNTSSDSPQLYYAVFDESSSAHSSPDVAQTEIGDAIPKGNSTPQYTTRTVTITRSKNARVCFYTSKAGNTKIYQIIADETGDALPVVGEAGYSLNMNKGRFALNGSKYGKIDGNIEIYAYNSYNMANGTSVQLDKNKTSSVYVKFKTPANPGKLKLTWSGSGAQMAYNTSASGSGATPITSNSEYSLSANTTYYLVNTGTATASITYLTFIVPTPDDPTFSEDENTEFVTNTSAAVTLTSTGNTIYYKWSTNSSAYAAAAGSTLASAADGSGTSPLSATAPSSAGTYYLYTVAYDGTSAYSHVVKRSYSIVYPLHSVSAVTSTGDNTYGTVSAASSSVRETSTTTITATPATGYQVSNWSVSGTGASISPSGDSNSNTTTLTMGTEDATVTVTFAPVSRTVTLDGQSATTAGTANVTATYGSAMPEIANLPEKTGYTFGGFYASEAGSGTQYYNGEGASQTNSNFSSDGTIYAKWTQTVVLDKNGSDSEDGFITVVFNGGQSGLTVPTYTGHTLLGFYTATSEGTKVLEADGSFAASSVTDYITSSKWTKAGATTLYAQWEINKYTLTNAITPEGYGTISPASVTDVPYGTTTSSSSNTYTVGETTVTATPADATAEYTYAFDSWSDLPATVTAAATITANFTRTANSYTLAWSTNGGSDLAGTYTSGTITYGTAITAPTDPTLSDYTFGGWYTANDGTGSAKESTMPAANTTYYAKWTQTVTLNANTDNNGSGDNSSATATLNATSLTDYFATEAASGYRLLGYYSAATSGVKVLNANGTFADEDVTGYITGGKWTKAGATELFAQMEEVAYYTVILKPNGGTIDDATGWTLENGQYKKSVEPETELSLPTFTKANRSFLTWRDDSDEEYESPITVSDNLTITAIWGKEETTTIYSWEGASSGATESGGTATHYNNETADSKNTRVNYKNTANGVEYYTISLNGATDYSSDHIRIALSQNIKTGDKVNVTAYYTNSNTRDAAPRMDTQSGTEIFAETTGLPNIYSSGSPVLRTYTVPSGINTNAIKMTRNLTGTNTFITKLQIVRPEIVEEDDPCETPTISGQPAGVDYDWDDEISALTVTASVTDGGTLSYQWYKKGSPDSEVGTNSSSYTPSVAGTYYVVVTNSKDGFEDASVTSDDAEITIADPPTHHVTYVKGTGSGTAPTETDKTVGETFTIKGKGDMVPPTGYYFTGWNDGTNDFAVGASYTMPDDDVEFTAVWTAIVAPIATTNHYKYYYKDTEHYDGSTYKNPKGITADSGDNQVLTDGSLCSSLGGITSVALASAVYDGKGDHMNAYIKITAGGTSKVTITIASGYVGILKLKAGGYSSNPTISVSSATLISGSVGGVATTEDNFNELVYVLSDGAHDITASSKNMYISEMDITTATSVSGTITPAGWASFSSSYPIDLSDITGGTAYYASDATVNIVTLTKITEKVPAGTGLMIKGTPNATFTVATTSEETTDLSTSNLLKAGTGASVAASTTGTYHYVFGYKTSDASVYGFYNLSTATTVPAGKAYLETTSALTDPIGGAPAIIRIVDEENTTTSIEAIGATDEAVKFIENGQLYILRDGVVYDALGRKVR